MQCKIFYALNPTFQVADLVVERLPETHVHLTTIEAETLDDAWAAMQAERWSPHGEARELIQSRGLVHTSMSIGDVLQADDDDYYQVAGSGFKKVPSLRVDSSQKRRAREIARDVLDASGVRPWENNRSPDIAPYVFQGLCRSAEVVGLPGTVGVLWEVRTARGFEGVSAFCYLQRITTGGVRDGNIENAVGIWPLLVRGQSSRGWAKSLVDHLVRIRRGEKADRHVKTWWPCQVGFNFAERIEEG